MENQDSLVQMNVLFQEVEVQVDEVQAGDHLAHEEELQIVILSGKYVLSLQPQLEEK